MSKQNPSDSEQDSENETATKEKTKTLTEYEKQRMSRIADNKAIMEALGLRNLASSFMGSMPKACQGKGKPKVNDDDDDDDEYAPDDDDDDGMDVDDDDDDDDDDEDFLATKARKTMVKKKTPNPKKKVSVQKQTIKSELVDEDKELMQAIALSLQDSSKDPSVVPIKEEKVNSSREDLGKKRRKSSFASRVKMTEDELIIHFFQFDEAGKEFITARDIEKMALAHDFSWTDKELADMIRCFDSDGDGKLSLDDFQNIVRRCNMIQDSEKL